MLGIILSILKIIGIVLLSILALIFAIILIVLFVPVRYRAKGFYKDKKFEVKGRVSYLLSIIRVIVLFDQKLDYYIRIFGIKINLKNRKPKIKKVKSDKNSVGNVVQPVETISEVSEDTDAVISVKEKEYNEDVSTIQKIDVAIDEKTDSVSQYDDSVVEDDKISENSVKKDEELVNEKVEEKASLSDKFEDVKFYLNLLGEDETKEAFRTCKHRIGNALKSILPNKGKIYIAFGSGDAGLIGEIFGFYEALFPYIGNVVTFVPVFTDKYIEISFDIKGKIRASSVLYQLVRIYFDKNCHRLIKIFIKKNRRK